MTATEIKQLRQEIGEIAERTDFSRASLVPILRHVKEKYRGIDSDAMQVTADGPDMVLQVEDDGLGADPATVGSRDGSGLDLLERRLSGLYGDAASLEWHTAPGKGFAVTLRWPRSAIGRTGESDGA